MTYRPFIWNIQNRPVYRDRKQTSGCWRVGLAEKQETIASWLKDLPLDLQTCSGTLNCTFAFYYLFFVRWHFNRLEIKHLSLETTESHMWTRGESRGAALRTQVETRGQSGGQRWLKNPWGWLYLNGFILLGPLKSRRHIFSWGNSLGPSTLSSWLSVSR